MTSPSVSPVEPGAGSGVRERLIKAGRDALVRQHHELFRAAQRAVGVAPLPYDECSDRTKRLKHQQMDPLADAVLAAVLPLIAVEIEHSTITVGGMGEEYAATVGYNHGTLDAAGLVRSWAADGAR